MNISKLLTSIITVLFAVLSISHFYWGVYFIYNMVLLYGAYRIILGVLALVCLVLWSKLN